MGLRGPGAKPKPKKKRPRKSRIASAIGAVSLYERVAQFIEGMPITSGVLAGQNFELLPCQHDILKAICKVDERGLRIVRQALVTTPRKQGKTTFTAALALCFPCGPLAEARGQVYSAAADRQQAALTYNEMKAIIAAVPELDSRIIVRDVTKHLEDTVTGSIYMALSSDSKTKHGLSASFWIYGELAQAPDRKLYDVLATSTAARAQPWGIVISMQIGDPHSIMSELVDYRLQVRDGVVKDETFLPVIYSAPRMRTPGRKRLGIPAIPHSGYIALWTKCGMCQACAAYPR